MKYKMKYKMNYRNVITLKRPPSWNGQLWKEALPLGNGINGGLLFGSAGEETILLNRHDLWIGNSNNMGLPDISEALKKTREMIDAGHYMQANAIMANAFNETGYQASTATPFPLGKIDIHMDISTPFSKYRRGIDLEKAEAFVRYDIANMHIEKKMFISRDNDMSFFLCENTDEMTNIIKLSRLNPEDEYEYDLKVSNNIAYYKISSENENKLFGAVMCIKPSEEGKVSIFLENNSKLCVKAKGYLIIVKTFYGDEQDYSVFDHILSESKIYKEVYNDFFSKHKILHSALYNTKSIELTTEEEHNITNEELLDIAYESSSFTDNSKIYVLAEKLWRFGRYLFISGTDESTNPFPLYGLWHGEYNLLWSQNVANENVQLIYQHAIRGGLSYSIKALINYYHTMIPQFEIAAKNIFGCSGIYITTYTTPKMGLPTMNVPVILNFISAAGWLSGVFYNYYIDTGDRVMLNEKILPFMYKTAQFYMDYITYDKEGYVRIYPSVSPENTPLNFLPPDFSIHKGHICPSVENATMDIAIVKELFTNLIDVCSKENIHTDQIEVWQQILNKIKPYMKNPDGDIKEWQHKDLNDHYNHRHLSHLYPVFPGNEVSSSNNSDLLPAFELAVDKRKLGGMSGWAIGHMANIYARLGRRDRVFECINILAKGCLLPNFFTTHNDWRHMGVSLDRGENAAVQLDALMGVVAAVQELEE